MNIKKIGYLTLLFLMLCSSFVCSESNDIICSTKVDGNTVTISGVLTNAAKEYEVVLMVGDWDNIIYINELTSTKKGQFVFQFTVPDTLPSGYYNFQIGTDGDYAIYHGFFSYAVTFRKPVVEAQLTGGKKSGIPTISGTVCCEPGKTLGFHLLNKTDNEVVMDYVVTSVDGVTDFECQLPGLQNIGLNEVKDYELLVTCTDGGKLVDIAVDIQATSFFLTFSGKIIMAENVDAEMRFRSIFENLTDKSLAIKGEYNLQKTIPTITTSVAFYVDAKVYESKPEEISKLKIGDIAAVGIHSKNIVNNEDVVFHVTYNAEQLELVDAVGNTYEKELTVGEYGNITVINITDGSIRFKLNSPESDFGMNGIVNIIKFKVLKENTMQVNVSYE